MCVFFVGILILQRKSNYFKVHCQNASTPELKVRLILHLLLSNKFILKEFLKTRRSKRLILPFIQDLIAVVTLQSTYLNWLFQIPPSLQAMPSRVDNAVDAMKAMIF